MSESSALLSSVFRSVACLGVLACMGCAGATDDAAAPFVGTWMGISGTYQDDCDDGTNSSGALVAMLTLAKGTESDLVTVPADGVCAGKLNIDGLVATYVTGICGSENTLSGTFTLETDHKLADVNVSETWTYPTKTCQQMVNGTYQKE